MLTVCYCELAVTRNFVVSQQHLNYLSAHKFPFFSEHHVYYVLSIRTVTSRRVSTTTARTRAAEMSTERLWRHTEFNFHWQQKTPNDTSKTVKGRTVCYDVCLLIYSLICSLNDVLNWFLSVCQFVSNFYKYFLNCFCMKTNCVKIDVFPFCCSEVRDRMRAFSRFHRFADHEQIQLALQRTFLIHDMLQFSEHQQQKFVVFLWMFVNTYVVLILYIFHVAF